MAAARATPPGEPVSVDVWNAAFAKRAKAWDVPLIPLEMLGLSAGSDGIIESAELRALCPGAEACPYLDESQKVVYKLFDLRPNGSLGKEFEIERSDDTVTPGVPEEDRYSIATKDATLTTTLVKLAYLNEAGAHPTEIVGLTDGGFFLLAKQPQAIPIHQSEFEEARVRAIDAMMGFHVRKVRLEKMVVALWVDGQPMLMSDLHRGNIMTDLDGRPTVIDALLGSVSPNILQHLKPLKESFVNAEALRRGRPILQITDLPEVPDEEL